MSLEGSSKEKKLANFDSCNLRNEEESMTLNFTMSKRSN